MESVVAEHVQPRGHVVFGEIVAAVDAVEIGDANAAIAISAGCRDLIGALRTEMIFSLNAGSARRAMRYHRGTQQEIEDRANAAGHDDADDHPKANAGAAARSVL